MTRWIPDYQRLTACEGPVPPQVSYPGVGGPNLMYAEWGYLRRLTSTQTHAAPAAFCRECGVVTHRISLSAGTRHAANRPHAQGCSEPAPRFPKLSFAARAALKDQLNGVDAHLRQLQDAEVGGREDRVGPAWPPRSPQELH